MTSREETGRQGETETVVPFLDLRITDPELRQELLDAIAATFDHGRFVRGPEIEAFEEALADYCGTRYAVGVGSGSIAIFLALRALGIGPGDEVVTTALSFVGTAIGIALAGATPVFADTRPDLTLDPAAAEAAIGPRTRAIMPVHFTGKICDMPALEAVAERHGLVLVEDAAPAAGAMLDGRRAGSFGVAGCLSINPMKILNGIGEAGAVLTDDETVRELLTALRYNGMPSPEEARFVSTNARLDTVQAAVLLKRMPRLEEIIERRREIAAVYQRQLADVVEVPRDAQGARDVYYTFTIQTDERDGLAEHLAARGVETKVQHSLLMPEHPIFGGAPADDALPVASRARRRLLCIPGHEKLDDWQVEHVVRSVREFFNAS